jgi:N-acetylmuramoyl-L-alanine amidase
MTRINGKYIIYIAIHFLFAHCIQAQTEIGNRIVGTVVIDPGHGGRDPGAIGKVSKEKDIALSIGLKLGKLINQRFPEVKVMYTRNDDRFIELYQRADIANKAKSDLFISIHANSTVKQGPSGVEFWVLGLHKADENLEVVKKENAALQFEQDVRKNYGFDPNSPEGSIIMTMQQNLYLDQSIQLAKLMESRFVREDNQLNRGSKQAGFIVLYKTSMPSVLVEVGFISNPDEEQYIANETGQTKIAANLANAFADYKLKYESGAIKQVSKAVENKTIASLPVENSNAANTGFTKASANGNVVINADESNPVAAVIKKESPQLAASSKPVSSDLDMSNNKKKIVVEDEVEKFSGTNSAIQRGEEHSSSSNNATTTIVNSSPSVKASYKPTSSNLEAKPDSKTIVGMEELEVKKKPSLTSTPIAEKFNKKTKVTDSPARKAMPEIPSKESMKKEIVDKSLRNIEEKPKPSLKINTSTPGKIKLDETESNVPSYIADKDIKKEIVDNTKSIDKRNNILATNAVPEKIETKSKTITPPASTSSAAPAPTKAKLAGNGIIYKVQIKASSVKIKSDDPINSVIEGVEVSFENNMYKYLVGSFMDEKEALARLEKVKNKGIKDAFLVKYKDGIRIK